MKKLFFIICILSGMLACDSMDDNYKQYLQNVKQYSPRVSNLQKKESIRTVELFWNNPKSDLAVKIQINTGDSIYIVNEMVEYYKLENLDIKGYEIAVYTIDRYGNLSVPATISAFPGTSIEGEN